MTKKLVVSAKKTITMAAGAPGALTKEIGLTFKKGPYSKKRR